MCVTGNVLDTGHAGCPLVTCDPHPLFQKRAKCDVKENQRPTKISALLIGRFGAKDGKRASLARKLRKQVVAPVEWLRLRGVEVLRKAFHT